MTTTTPEDAQRIVSKEDNLPPEVLPQQLAPAAELPTVMKSDVDAAIEKALFELDTYSRVPPEIASKEIYERVTTLTTRLNEVLSGAETKRKEHKAPYQAAATLIDDTFKLKVVGVDGAKDRMLKKELEDAVASLKKRLSGYDTKIYLEQLATEKAERDALAEKVAADGITMDTVQTDTAIASTVKSAHGGSSVRNLVTTWTVIDEALIPRSLLSIDPAKVQKMIDDGAVEIPGLALSKEVKTHVKKR